MEAGAFATKIEHDRTGPLAQGAELLQPENPPFVTPEIHMKELEARRVEAERALEFHSVRRDEAQAVIASCDSGLATMREVAPPLAHR